MLIFGTILGIALHREAGLHGALATSIALIAAFSLLTLIVYVSFIFWTWTLGLAGTTGYQLFNAVKDAADLGWGIFAGIVSAVIVIVLHCISRADFKAEDDTTFIVKD
jgi:hypothetical protein